MISILNHFWRFIVRLEDWGRILRHSTAPWPNIGEQSPEEMAAKWEVAGQCCIHCESRVPAEELAILLTGSFAQSRPRRLQCRPEQSARWWMWPWKLKRHSAAAFGEQSFLLRPANRPIQNVQGNWERRAHKPQHRWSFQGIAKWFHEQRRQIFIKGSTKWLRPPKAAEQHVTAINRQSTGQIDSHQLESDDQTCVPWLPSRRPR